MVNGPQKVLVTRRTWAAMMLPALAIATVLGGVAVWLTGQPRFLVAPVSVFGIWAWMHFSTPATGVRSSTIRGTPGAITMLGFCGAALLLTVALGVLDTCLLGHPFKAPLKPYHAVLYAPPFLLLFLGAYLADRKRSQQPRE